ncbi:hypothetical protein VIGAN_04271100, partial [Vigna angularis var. angularis]
KAFRSTFPSTFCLCFFFFSAFLFLFSISLLSLPSSLSVFLSAFSFRYALILHLHLFTRTFHYFVFYSSRSLRSCTLLFFYFSLSFPYFLLASLFLAFIRFPLHLLFFFLNLKKTRTHCLKLRGI